MSHSPTDYKQIHLLTRIKLNSDIFSLFSHIPVHKQIYIFYIVDEQLNDTFKLLLGEQIKQSHVPNFGGTSKNNVQMTVLKCN